MYVERHAVSITTDGSGDGTGYTPVVTGMLVGVVCDTGTLDGGATVDLLGETTGVQALSSAAPGSLDGSKVPVQIPTDGALSAFLYAAGGKSVAGIPFVFANERIQIVVASGGATKSGTFHVLIGG